MDGGVRRCRQPLAEGRGGEVSQHCFRYLCILGTGWGLVTSTACARTAPACMPPCSCFRVLYPTAACNGTPLCINARIVLVRAMPAFSLHQCTHFVRALLMLSGCSATRRFKCVGHLVLIEILLEPHSAKWPCLHPFHGNPIHHIPLPFPPAWLSGCLRVCAHHAPLSLRLYPHNLCHVNACVRMSQAVRGRGLGWVLGCAVEGGSIGLAATGSGRVCVWGVGGDGTLQCQSCCFGCGVKQGGVSVA